jgi:hypothetical protein
VEDTLLGTMANKREIMVNVSKPKLPKTTKIDTVTGKGTPGGFRGASTKNPKKESAAIQGDIGKMQQPQSLTTPPPTLEEKKNVDRALAAKQTELKVANRAPDFSRGVRVQ